ncbi:hypothetical protein EVAR_94360_1 [Eumeta japonica]|uniref:Uncharacterized protein n=1 Tax=Eumeta variegata TaxID=151549 RepID=A0A4C1TPW8_EUMVA|nr:hypothetical protein EVAR_94360_1 [Eumeta japonica]
MTDRHAIIPFLYRVFNHFTVWTYHKLFYFKRRGPDVGLFTLAGCGSALLTVVVSLTLRQASNPANMCSIATRIRNRTPYSFALETPDRVLEIRERTRERELSWDWAGGGGGRSGGAGEGQGPECA